MNQFETEDQYSESYRKYGDNNVKVLISMYKGNYHRFLLAALFYIIKQSPVWVMPIVISNIVNTVITGSAEDMRSIFMNVAFVGGLVLLNVPMNYLHNHFTSSAVREVEAGIRSALIRKLQHLSFAFHKNAQSGRLQSKIIRDVEGVQTLSQQLFVSLLNLVINISIALTITAMNNLTVFVFFVLTIPVASIIIVFFRKQIKDQNHRFRLEVEATSASVMDMEDMIFVTRAHGLEGIEVKRLDRMIRSISNHGYRLDILQANFSSVSWAVFQFFQLGCLIFTAGMVINGRILPGDIVLYQTYFTTIIAQVSGLLLLLPTLAKGMESITSIGEILKDNNIEENEGKYVMDTLRGSYEFKDVSFKYPESDSHVLKNLSLEVKEGEMVAFVGGSGAGKSTAVNLLVGFDLATSGQLTVDGHDMGEINRRTYRKHIAVVPQNTILFAGTIKDNITYGLKEVDDEAIYAAIEGANLTAMIEDLPEGIDTMIGERGGKLSGGQRQRIAIARALIRAPKVILFDEATSSLDSVSETMILEAMDHLVRGRTTFIVAHRLSTIKKADKICVMDQGVCVEMGTYDELMDRKDYFYNMKSLQS